MLGFSQAGLGQRKSSGAGNLNRRQRQSIPQPAEKYQPDRPSIVVIRTIYLVDARGLCHSPRNCQGEQNLTGLRRPVRFNYPVPDAGHFCPPPAGQTAVEAQATGYRPLNLDASG
jgi:hypothetical protein